MSFVPSMTEPPPTASRKSTSRSLPSAIASRSVSIDGLGSMPQNSTVSRPARAHLVVDAVAPDRAAAESHHHALAGWNQLAEPGDRPLAEDQLRGVLKNEILHNFLYRRFTCLCTDRANAAILKRIHPSLPPISSAGRTPWDVPSSRGRPCRRSRSLRFRASSQAPKRRP